jgi:hypothetical protein
MQKSCKIQNTHAKKSSWYDPHEEPDAKYGTSLGCYPVSISAGVRSVRLRDGPAPHAWVGGCGRAHTDDRKRRTLSRRPPPPLGRAPCGEPRAVRTALRRPRPAPTPEPEAEAHSEADQAARASDVACPLELPLCAGSPHAHHAAARCSCSRTRGELLLAATTLLSATLCCSGLRLFSPSCELLLLRMLLLLCVLLLLVGTSELLPLLLLPLLPRCSLAVPFYALLLALVLHCAHLLFIVLLRLLFT